MAFSLPVPCCIYLFLAVLGLCCCVRAFSSCGELASHCSGFLLQNMGAQASAVAAHRLSSYSPRMQAQ